jgi:chromosome segregation ATPase
VQQQRTLTITTEGDHMAEKPGTAKDKAAKQKRTILTASQRIEKMQAEVEALKVKEQEKAKAKLVANEKDIATLEKKVADAQTKLDQAKAIRLELQALAGVTVGEAPDTTSA